MTENNKNERSIRGEQERIFLMEKYPDLPEKATVEDWISLGIDPRALRGGRYPGVEEDPEDGRMWIEDAFLGASLREEDLEYKKECERAEEAARIRAERGWEPLTANKIDMILSVTSEMCNEGIDGVPDEATVEEWKSLGVVLRNEDGTLFPEAAESLRNGLVPIDIALEEWKKGHKTKPAPEKICDHIGLDEGCELDPKSIRGK